MRLFSFQKQVAPVIWNFITLVGSIGCSLYGYNNIKCYFIHAKILIQVAPQWIHTIFFPVMISQLNWQPVIFLSQHVVIFSFCSCMQAREGTRKLY